MNSVCDRLTWRRRIASLLLAAGGITWFSVLAIAARGDDAPPTATTDENAAIEKALGTLVSLDVKDQPLEAVVNELAKSHTIPIALDRKALEDAGTLPDTRVTLLVREMTLRSALSHLLGSVGLTAVPEAGVLIVTTDDKSKEILTQAIYNVADLVDAGSEEGPDYDPLIDLVKSTIGPTTWDDVGGPGSVAPFRSTLIVNQTVGVHAGVKDLLAAVRALRQQKDQPATNRAIWLGTTASAAAQERIEKKLAEKLPLTLTAQPLNEVVRQLRERTGLNVWLHDKALEDAAVDRAVPVTLSAENLPLGRALELALDPVGLRYTFDNEALLITTQERCLETRLVRAYSVRDLIASDPTDDCDATYDALINAIKSTVQPTTWDDVGGPGSIGAFEPAGALVVATTFDAHHQVEALLANLRRTMPPPKHAAQGDTALVLRAYRLVGTAPMTQDVAKAIPAMVEPDLWGTQEVYVKVVAGSVLVRQTPAVHKQVRKFLGMLGVVAPSSQGQGGVFGGPSRGKPARRGPTVNTPAAPKTPLDEQ